MQQIELQPFLEKAEDRLAGIRASLLLFGQGRIEGSELLPACQRLAGLRLDAECGGLESVGSLAADAASAIEHLACSGYDADAFNSTLDTISKIEAELLSMPLAGNGFAVDAGEMLEARFGELIGEPSLPDALSGFEIDEETLEIFREEAESLIVGIRSSLSTLSRDISDRNALWEIRRCAHTLKGAAGIVGLTEASALAHAVEDLLDTLVGTPQAPDADCLGKIGAAVDRIASIASGRGSDADCEIIAELDKSKVAASEVASTVPAGIIPPTPVVRVSLDRLDSLLELSNKLLERTSEAASLSEHALAETMEELHSLSLCVRAGLQQIRMVRFSVLEMRLNRAVNVTCQEENKRASILIEDPDVEVDTLVIDALIEPLLHLLKNSVVHGIERAERRRLLGKPEIGLIKIGLAANDELLRLTVEDDGRGISTPKLLEKALDTGIVSPAAAASIEDDEILELIFERGLTTSDTLTMSAGRGVGMSIVKESVEGRGGRITVESEPHQGTRFVIDFPLKPIKGRAVDDREKPLVLVVDDSNSIRRMTAKIVESAGYRVITAINGSEALELLLSGTHRPDLILSDVEMPVMDGWQFLEYVKTDDSLGRIPMVMVTSLSSDAYRKKAADLGADDYLVKPFKLEDLERVFAANFV